MRSTASAEFAAISPCILVVIGATEDGQKEPLAIEAGSSENEFSWENTLLDLRGRGLEHAPSLAIAAGLLEGA